MLTGRHAAETEENPPRGEIVVTLLACLGRANRIDEYLSITPSGSYAEILEDIHEFLGEFSLLLIAAHIAGVTVMSILEHQNLAKSMIDGKKFVSE